LFYELESAPICSGKIEKTTHLGFPLFSSRPIPEEVPKEIAEDYQQASVVLPFSEKASAALSRRCLQNILNAQGITGRDLNDQIDVAIGKVPTHIGDSIDAVRQVGNYAAHPTKTKDTGIIVDVEPDEAELSLEVIEQLFDFYYVQPARSSRTRAKINEKLAASGKQELKKPED